MKCRKSVQLQNMTYSYCNDGKHRPSKATLSFNYISAISLYKIYGYALKKISITGVAPVLPAHSANERRKRAPEAGANERRLIRSVSGSEIGAEEA